MLASDPPPSFRPRAGFILFIGVVSALIVWLTIGVRSALPGAKIQFP